MLLPVKNTNPPPMNTPHLNTILGVFVQTYENTQVETAFFTHGYYIQLSNVFNWGVMTYLCIHEIIFHKLFKYGVCKPRSLLSSGN